MPKPGTERAVVDGAANLEQQISAISDHRICWDLFIRRLTRKFAVPSVTDVPTRTGAVSFGIVDQPCGLAPEIFIDRMQRVPQLARRHALCALALLTFEDMHHLADPLNAARAFFALPFQIRQCRRSTSATITALAVTRSGVSVDKLAADNLVCCKPSRCVG